MSWCPLQVEGDGGGQNWAPILVFTGIVDPEVGDIREEMVQFHTLRPSD